MSAEHTASHVTPEIFIHEVFVSPQGYRSLLGADASAPVGTILHHGKHIVDDFTQPEVDRFTKFLLTGITLEDAFWDEERRIAALRLFSLIDLMKVTKLEDLLTEAIRRVGIGRPNLAVGVLQAAELSVDQLTPIELYRVKQSADMLLHMYNDENIEKMADRIKQAKGVNEKEKQMVKEAFEARERGRYGMGFILSKTPVVKESDLVKWETQEELESAFIGLRKTDRTNRDIARRLGISLDQVEKLASDLIGRGLLASRNPGKTRRDS